MLKDLRDRNVKPDWITEITREFAKNQQNAANAGQNPDDVKPFKQNLKLYRCSDADGKYRIAELKSTYKYLIKIGIIHKDCACRWTTIKG